MDNREDRGRGMSAIRFIFVVAMILIAVFVTLILGIIAFKLLKDISAFNFLEAIREGIKCQIRRFLGFQC
jgi:hypothetical protein